MKKEQIVKGSRFKHCTSKSVNQLIYSCHLDHDIVYKNHVSVYHVDFAETLMRYQLSFKKLSTI